MPSTWHRRWTCRGGKWANPVAKVEINGISPPMAFLGWRVFRIEQCKYVCNQRQTLPHYFDRTPQLHAASYAPSLRLLQSHRDWVGPTRRIPTQAARMTNSSRNAPRLPGVYFKKTDMCEVTRSAPEALRGKRSSSKHCPRRSYDRLT